MYHPVPEPAQAPEPTDAALIDRALCGDGRASGELIDRYRRLVYSIPRRYGLADDLCDDVFQTVFIALVKALPSLRDSKTLPKQAGFVRAFLGAGASGLVMSLWPVHDESTRWLMRGFYTRATRPGVEVPAALREAQLELRESSPHPAAWAPFVCVAAQW